MTSTENFLQPSTHALRKKVFNTIGFATPTAQARGVGAEALAIGWVAADGAAAAAGGAFSREQAAQRGAVSGS